MSYHPPPSIRSRRRRTLRGWLRAALALLLLAPAEAPANASPDVQELPRDLTELSLEDLSMIQVTSVARKPQDLAHSPAAVFVLTHSDIRNSGATSIPEALRLVPGLHVARISSSSWAITSRGFNRLYANKMLVQVDGRTVYSPLFAGVFWETQELYLEDVDRIEVNRGPGATMWGANAVNGVINIITKSAHETTGSHGEVGFGTEDKGLGGFRYGGALGSAGAFRAHAKFVARDSLTGAGGRPGSDAWESASGGFRADWSPNDTDRWTLSGDIFSMRAQQRRSSASLAPPFVLVGDHEDEADGGNAIGRMHRRLSSQSDLTIQAYFDRTRRDVSRLFSERRNTFDLDIQHRFRVSARNELLWGGGYRLTSDDSIGSSVVELSPESRKLNLASAFVQDELILSPERLNLTLGSKFEHNDYTGLELQPSARLLFLPTAGHTLWASVSRAVRTPSRTERDVRFNSATFPSSDGLVQLVSVFGNDGFGSEVLVAYELGYRAQMGHVHVDLAAFYNDYDRLSSTRVGAPFVEADPTPLHVVVPTALANDNTAVGYGFELASSWDVNERLRLRGWYAWLSLETESADGVTLEDGSDPDYQARLEGHFQLLPRLRVGTTIHRVAEIPEEEAAAYTRWDAYVAWQLERRLRLRFDAQNLLDAEHREFGERQSFGLLTNLVQRSFIVRFELEL